MVWILPTRIQHTIVNDTVSYKIEVAHEIPQELALSRLLFLIYINNLNEAISHYIINHFADDTNILFSHKSLKNINYINHDLSQIVQWLKIVSATFLLVCFVSLKESTFETRKSVFYFTWKALFVHEIIRF